MFDEFIKNAGTLEVILVGFLAGGVFFIFTMIILGLYKSASDRMPIKKNSEWGLILLKIFIGALVIGTICMELFSRSIIFATFFFLPSLIMSYLMGYNDGHSKSIDEIIKGNKKGK